MRQLLGTFAIVALVAAIVCFANGWLVFHKNSQSTTVEIKTEQIKDAADRVVEQSKDFIQESASPRPAPVIQRGPVIQPTPVTPIQPEQAVEPTYPITPPVAPQSGTPGDLYAAPVQP